MTSTEQPQAGGAFPWLLRQKVAIPERVPGYVHRPELEARATPTRRRLTILQASGGFGKTCLLAECCRRLREEGVAVAWISLDDQDEPAVLDAYIAFACQSAGLNLLDVPDPDKAPVGPGSRIGLVSREIQSSGAPFVIAFDELERLKQPASLALLGFLLQRGPSNLHLAVACREIPDDLNVAGALLEGRAELVDTEDLRFSQADVARFFDLRLSRRRLADEMSRSAGWPFALRLSRNSSERGPPGPDVSAQSLAANWIESRLFAYLEPGDRDLVLDVGLFGWFDAGLLGAVLQRGDAMRRLQSLPLLAGLLEPVDGAATASWRLHALVREHCARQRLRETPERFGAIQRRIATALARRGETVLAMRYAVEGNGPALAGEILERAGGVRLWPREGTGRLQEANRLLSEDVLATRPRLRLVRCLALVLTGGHREARALYRECPQPAHGDEDDTGFEHSVDDCLVRYAMGLYGGDSVGSNWLRTLPGDLARLLRSPHLDPATRGQVEYGLAILYFLKGEFDHACERLSAVRESPGGSRYLALHGELLQGQIDFVQGRAEDARSRYGKARRIARKGFLLDPVAAASCEITIRELTLERARTSAVAEPPGLLRTLTAHGIVFSLFAIGSSLLIDGRLRSGRVDQALAAADDLLAYTRRAGLTAFARLLAALRISALVMAGRFDDAEGAWRREGFPEDPSDCVDLAGQSFREMEAISEARVRLLVAAKRFDAARALLGALRAVAVERRFRTLEMRASALSILLEHHAGDTETALHYVTEYLTLYAESPYAWPLLRERTTCLELVGTYLDLDGDASRRQAARLLLEAMRRLDGRASPSLSEREREVLQRLPGHRDKEIAAALALSAHGVRFHLRKLFRKLGAGNRAEAVRRARELGLIPDDA